MEAHKIKWIEFLFFPIMFFLPLVLNVILSLFNNLFGHNIFNSIGSKDMGILLDFIISLVIILLFLLLNKNNILKLKSAIVYLKMYWKSILIILISVRVIFEGINKLITFFDSQWSLSSTENQSQINNWINEPNSLSIAIITFFSIVIIGPMLEEILYRHLIIGELSKIFPYRLMSIVSLFIFALIHVESIKSLDEIILYLILGFPIVFVYIKSNFNVYASIFVHIFMNFISYTYILLT